MTSNRHSHAFTLVEALVVVAIIALLALMALPSFTDKIVRDQVVEGIKLADLAKKNVGAAYAAAATGELPADNAAALLPPPDKMVSNYVSSMAVVDGAITMTFGNNAGTLLIGKKLTLRPAIVPGYPQTPLDWVCNEKPVPKNMEAKGKNLTDIPPQYLPVSCRAPTAQ